MKEIINKYKKKIKSEALIKSFIKAISIGFIVSIVVAIIALLIDKNLLLISIYGFVSSSLLATLFLYIFIYRISDKDVAIRIDNIGLEERVLTMYEYENVDDFMVNLQRKDAKEKINEVTKKDIKFSFKKAPIYLLGITFIIACNLNIVSVVSANNNTTNPPNINNNTNNNNTSTSKLDVNTLLQTLRDVINSAPVDKELKIQLHLLVDELELDLPFYESDVAKLARIKETQEKIAELLQKAMEEMEDQEIYWTTAGALMIQGGDNMYILGHSISTKSEEELQKAFEQIYEDLANAKTPEELIEKLTSYGNNILAALENSINDNRRLRGALRKMANSFLEMANDIQMALDRETTNKIPDENSPKNKRLAYNEEGSSKENEEETIEDNRTTQEVVDDTYLGIEEIMEKAYNVIKETMDQTDLEETQDQLDNIFDMIFGNPDTDTDVDYDEDGNPIIVPDTGNINGNEFVIDGETPYKDVFNMSYEEAVALIQSGAITKEEAEIIAKYFNILDPNIQE